MGLLMDDPMPSFSGGNYVPGGMLTDIYQQYGIDKAIDPNAILRQVLAENKGLANTHPIDSTEVHFASPERIGMATAFMKKHGYGDGPGFLEYWPQDEIGTPDYSHPSPGKTVLEIYSNELMNNPDRLKNAIYGDLMHGMDKDPNWYAMREEFKKNYTPEELIRIANRQSWWADANGASGGTPNAGHDAYIRGYLNENDIAMKGQNKSGGTMYSPRQLEILDAMLNYLKTGQVR